MIDSKIYLPLFRNSNVHLVGYGFKQIKGVTTQVPSIQCAVEEKIPMAQLSKSQLIPDFIDGMPTDVIISKRIRIPVPNELRNKRPVISQQLRPCLAGASIGHMSVTAGTLGFWAKYEDNTRVFVSNNHVIAASNKANNGDAILQPGIYDGGVYPDDEFGLLAMYVPIVFVEEKKSQCCAKVFANKIISRLFNKDIIANSTMKYENTVDCAAAMPLNTDWVDEKIIGIGEVNPVCVEPRLGLVCHKYGRTTGYSSGRVIQLDAAVEIEYDGKKAIFVNQIVFDAMSAAGDSGSLILTKEGNNPVGLLFAGSTEITIANPIKHVMAKLAIHF